MDLSFLKADLPNTPEEVISVWLLTHFKRFGWSPQVDNDWRYILGLGNGLQFLQGLNWNKATIALTPNMLCERWRQIAIVVALNGLDGSPSIMRRR